jgi:hypothetical protein
MFGDHIANALAHERQRDLVPAMRKHERQRSVLDIENGETTDTHKGVLGSQPRNRAWSWFVQALPHRHMGRRQMGNR